MLLFDHNLKLYFINHLNRELLQPPTISPSPITGSIKITAFKFILAHLREEASPTCWSIVTFTDSPMNPTISHLYNYLMLSFIFSPSFFLSLDCLLCPSIYKHVSVYIILRKKKSSFNPKASSGLLHSHPRVLNVITLLFLFSHSYSFTKYKTLLLTAPLHENCSSPVSNDLLFVKTNKHFSDLFATFKNVDHPLLEFSSLSV